MKKATCKTIFNENTMIHVFGEIFQVTVDFKAKTLTTTKYCEVIERIDLNENHFSLDMYFNKLISIAESEQQLSEFDHD